MTRFHDAEYWEARLKQLLESREPENLHLDYKERRSLMPSGRGGGGIDKEKRADDVSKDVTSFLNSDGGTLIYGIPETTDANSTGGTPIPIENWAEIGFSRGEITKETIENLITSNIQPKPGANLFRITEVPWHKRLVFVVEVAPGIGDVWQAKDKRYYKRFHYKAEPMEHYEINMVRSRNRGPNLKMVFGLNGRWEKLSPFFATDKVTLHLGLRNDADLVAETALLELGIPRKINIFKIKGELDPFIQVRDRALRGIVDGDREMDWDWFECRWPVRNEEWKHLEYPIFKALDPIEICKVRLEGRFSSTPPADTDPIFGWLAWRVQTPNATPKEGVTTLVLKSHKDALEFEEFEGSFEII